MCTSFQPDRPLWTKYWQSLYEVPRAWAIKGENLIHAFEAVAVASDHGSIQFNMMDQALMLAGMAVEVQLKAILVNRPEVREVVSGVRKPDNGSEQKILKSFYSHKLVDLAEIAGVLLTPERIKVASGLTQYIYWRGRYVVPTEHAIDDIVPRELDDGLVGLPHHDLTIDAARDLIELIITEVKLHMYARLRTKEDLRGR